MQNFDLKTDIVLFVLYIHGFLAGAFKKSCNLILNAFLVIYFYSNIKNNILKIEIFLYWHFSVYDFTLLSLLNTFTHVLQPFMYQ